MMRQLLAVAGFELRYHRRRISTWVYFGIFLVIGFVMMSAEAGVWDGFDSGGGGRLANSPSAVTRTLVGLLLLGLPVTAALFGNVIHRDFQTGIHPLFFTSPVRKSSYLGGRFLAAVVLNTLILSGAALGQTVAAALPFVKPERIGPFAGVAYLQAFVYLIIPALLFAGAVFFALAALTRQMLPNYIGGVTLLLGYTVAMQQMSDLDNRELAALFDPFGMAPLGLTTRYWTVAELNTQLLPYDGVLLGNRLVWLAVTLLLLGALFWRFRFAHLAQERRARRAAPLAPSVSEPVLRPVELPRARRSFAAGAQWLQFRSTARREFWSIVRNVYFAALAGVGLIFAVFMATQVGEIQQTNTYPVTYAVLEAVTGGFALFMIIIVTFYAGELVWRERELRASQLHDSTPVASWVPLLAKLAALAGVVAVLQAVVGMVGLGTQVVHGYFRFELGQYLTELYVRQYAMYLLFAVLAVAVHVVSNHKYLGHFALITYFVATPIAYHRLGWEHNLYNFGGGGETTYSDMNGYGHSWTPWAWFHLYWGVFAVLLVLLGNLLWVRGEETGTAWRMRLMRQRFTRPVRAVLALASLGFVGLGGFVFYNTNHLNQYHSSREMERLSAEYEKRYRRLAALPQPRVTSVELDVDIYPARRDAHIRGRYWLTNRTARAIDSVVVDYPADVTRRSFRFGTPATAALTDDARGLHIYRLATPLAPGDSVRLEWEVAYLSRGFENSVSNDPVIHNGTFFNSGHVPHIGYSDEGELQDDDTRRKYGLAPQEGEPDPDSPVGRRDPYISRDADWVRFAATVSTDADQVALAPGYLKREWREGGRRFFRYEMDAPILNFYAFLSARYAVKRDRWGDVALEIYYHPGHEYNLDRMMEAARQSLAYYSAAYGPFQHRVLRIVEFPRYAAFAQAFPTIVPFSEGIGFIARVTDEGVDYPYHTTAHEVAHQWWAHQVIGARARGSTLMSESMSEYASLVVLEQKYGTEGIKRALRHELEQYLAGRAGERKREEPLVRMRGEQTYLRYAKGALAMYALRDYLGEERLNQALRRYVADTRFQQPPYTNSTEFVRYLRQATPDSLQYLITDWFETITLYENRALEARARRLSGGRWEVQLELEAKKVRADSIGNQTPIGMSDWIDVGVFARSGTRDEKLGAPLYLRKHRLTGGRQTIRVVVSGEPDRAGVDPLHRLIDRQMSDNTVAVKRP